jgi:hypothetical protein
MINRCDPLPPMQSENLNITIDKLVKFYFTFKKRKIFPHGFDEPSFYRIFQNLGGGIKTIFSENSGNINSIKECGLWRNVCKFLKKAIKYILPYGLVRAYKKMA